MTIETEEANAAANRLARQTDRNKQKKQKENNSAV
jgi:hypothetical protein